MTRESIRVAYNFNGSSYPELCDQARSTINSQLAVLHARVAEAVPASLGLEESGWRMELASVARGSIGTPQSDGKWTRYIWEGDSVTVQEYEGDRMLAEMAVGDDYSAFEALLAFQTAIFDLDDFVYASQQH